LRRMMKKKFWKFVSWLRKPYFFTPGAPFWNSTAGPFPR
jgi:hypothetical protein